MGPSFPEIAARARHLLSILFSEWMVIGLVLAGLAWFARPRLRAGASGERLLVTASVVALAWLASIQVAAAWLVYALAFYAVVEHCPRRWLTPPAVVLLLAAMVILPVVAIGALGTQGRHVREFVAFATNMAALRFYAYFWERWRGLAEPEPVRRFLLAMFFFPTFVNGPLGAPSLLEDGGPGSRARRRLLIGGGGRIAAGAAKLLVAGLAFPPGWTSALAGGLSAPVTQLWLWGMLLYAWFYLSFSAWADVAIGLGRLCGRQVPENFVHPWAATDPADFWHRWHASLGLWLRDYVYIPLGGGRRRRAVNVVATFVVSAAWHIWGSVKLLGLGFFGPHAWSGFLVWGGLNAAGVLASRPLRRGLRALGPWGPAAGRVLTLLFASWTWVAFFTPPGVSPRACVATLLRMLWPF